MTTPDGRLLEMSKVAARLLIDKESERLLRLYLHDRLQSPEIRKSVVARAMKTGDVRRLVDRALANADTWVRAEKPNVFEACDRLRAEGEFRRGVAVPLAFVLASICSLYAASIWVILAVTVPMAFVYFSGLKKQEDAASIVVDCISAGVANFNLNVEDVRLLRWPNQSISLNEKKKRKSPLALLFFDRRIDSGNPQSSSMPDSSNPPEAAG